MAKELKVGDTVQYRGGFGLTAEVLVVGTELGTDSVKVRWSKGGITNELIDNLDVVNTDGIEFVVQDLNTPEMREVVRYRAHSIDTDNAPILIFFDANDVPTAFHHLAPNHSVIPLTDG